MTQTSGGTWFGKVRLKVDISGYLQNTPKASPPLENIMLAAGCCGSWFDWRKSVKQKQAQQGWMSPRVDEKHQTITSGSLRVDL